MKTVQRALLTVALSTFVLNLCGCGTPSDRPELGEVTGTITMDGEPLSEIVVVFNPDNGRPARGKTDMDGIYELTYIGKTKGCKVGHNRVEIAPSEEGEEDSEDSSDTENLGAAKRPLRGRVQVPARYNSKSELEVDVEPGKNVFDFKLESKSQPEVPAASTQ